MSQEQDHQTFLEVNQNVPKNTTKFDADISSLVKSSSLVRTNTSPENPLLPVSVQEYMTLKRFQNESKIPDRFKTVAGTSTANERSFYRTRSQETKPAMFRTSYGEFGQFPPNKHTTATTYHGLDTKFTAKIARHGMYRNHSVNL